MNMKLKCIKSKTSLFDLGKTYEVTNRYRDDETRSIIYVVKTKYGSICHTAINSRLGQFIEVEE